MNDSIQYQSANYNAEGKREFTVDYAPGGGGLKRAVSNQQELTHPAFASHACT